MPCEYELDLKRRWVQARGLGVVTYAEARATWRKFAEDPNFAPDFCQLYDGRAVTRIALTASEIGELAREDVFGPGSRRAFVAPRRDTYDVARAFKMYRELNAGKEKIRVFQTMEAAEAWLEK
jgi:hypothetical protein